MNMSSNNTACGHVCQQTENYSYLECGAVAGARQTQRTVVNNNVFVLDGRTYVHGRFAIQVNGDKRIVYLQTYLTRLATVHDKP